MVEFAKENKIVTKTSVIASINMTQICDRFLMKKPLFLSLDIEGYGSLALQGNDWSK